MINAVFARTQSRIAEKLLVIRSTHTCILTAVRSQYLMSSIQFCCQGAMPTQTSTGQRFHVQHTTSYIIKVLLAVCLFDRRAATDNRRQSTAGNVEQRDCGS